MTCREPGLHIQTYRQTHVRRMVKNPGNGGGMDVCIEMYVKTVSRFVDGTVCLSGKTCRCLFRIERDRD